MSILAIGSVAFDSIETPFGKADRILGGSATYITLSARYFCKTVRLVGVVGADFPDDCVDLLKDRGVDTDGLVIDPNGKTFFWAGKYHNDLNHRDTLTTEINVLADFDPNIPQHYRDSKIVCLGNLDPIVQMKVLDQIEKPDIVVCDTMNFWMDSAWDSLIEMLKRVDILIINDSEARQLADEPNLIKAAKIILAMGPHTLIIKKGEHGALLFAEDQIFSAPAYPLEDLFDPTGAGDTFAGGFIGYLSEHNDYSLDSLKRAVIYGSAMASFVVEKFGPEQLYNLTREDIEERVDGFHRLSAIPAK